MVSRSQIEKEHILNEIDRTAKANNGKPLGKQRFEKETGIKDTDWFGKYWSKWSDAIIEAGYAPNKMQLAYNEDQLIQQVISFIREIGKVPTGGEIRLKAHNTRGFPSLNTISNRFGGNQSKLANNIMDYCKGNPEYSDVCEICEKVSSITKQDEEYYIKEPIIEFGYVYLMKSGRYYKVGKSKNVEMRNYELGIKLPEDITIVHKIKTDDPTGIEDYWHKRFSNKRKQGEWFDLSPNDIATFKRRKFM